MRVIVAGGRGYTDRRVAFQALDQIDLEIGGICTVIEGGQRTTQRGKTVGGADFLGQQWAESRGVAWDTMPAEWSRWGKAMAGRLRNQEMLRRWQPHYLVAFPGNEGTKDMIERALLANVEVLCVRESGLVVPARLQ